MQIWTILVAVAVAVAAAGPVLAQNAGQAAKPDMPKTDAEWMAWMPNPANLEMPQLAFEETKDAVGDYDKYFYFHRDDTKFAEALSDIRECDARARKLWRGPPSAKKDYVPSPYGIVGAAAQAFIFGPAQDRLFRRANLRRCMFYKGYSRYGLAKELWEAFNFQRVDGDLTEGEIQTDLARQALVASGPRPNARELGL